MESEFMSIASNDLLYMAEAGNNRVDVFDLNGEFKFLFGDKGSDGEVSGDRKLLKLIHSIR